MIQDLIDSSTASGLSNVPKTQHIYSDDTATRLARGLLLNILPIHRRAYLPMRHCHGSHGRYTEGRKKQQSLVSMTTTQQQYIGDILGFILHHFDQVFNLHLHNLPIHSTYYVKFHRFRFHQIINLNFFSMLTKN